VNKLYKKIGVSFLSLVSFGVLAQNTKQLNVYNWSDYIAEDTLNKFEQQTKIKVTYDVFDSNEVLEAKLLAGKSGYDVVVPSANFMAKQIKGGVYEKLDKSKLNNYSNLDPKLLKILEVIDPNNEHGVPYMWGTIGIAYNLEKVTAVLGANPPVNSWDLVFKVENMAKLKECGVSFLDSPTEMLPAAFKFLGIKPDTTNPTKEELKKAEDLFMQIRPFTAYFHSSKYISDLANGNICVAIGYSGDLYQSIARAKEAGGKVKLSYNIPKEGAATFFDILGIPKDAENKENAYKFINFLLEPKIMAEIINEMQFSSGNAKTQNLVNKELASDPNIFPSDEVLANLYTFPDLPAAVQRNMNRIWTKIKSGK